MDKRADNKSPLDGLPSLSRLMSGHINLLKEQLKKCTKDQIINYYLDYHPSETKDSFKHAKKQPWKQQYIYGIGRDCCPVCGELEEAIAQIINEHPKKKALATWFPVIAHHVKPRKGNQKHQEKTALEIKEEMKDKGISITEWAESNNFPLGSVYSVLDGKLKAMRGTSHEIAVALGLRLTNEQIEENKEPKKKTKKETEINKKT